MVTAGATGIGAAIARAFVADGAQVAVADVDGGAVEQLVAEQPSVRAAVLDVSAAVAVDAWFDHVLGEWDGLDVLVNNAGVAGPTAFVEDVSLDDWRRCLAVGLESHFLTSRRAAAVMKAQRSGSVVAIASTAGLFGY